MYFPKDTDLDDIDVTLLLYFSKGTDLDDISDHNDAKGTKDVQHLSSASDGNSDFCEDFCWGRRSWTEPRAVLLYFFFKALPIFIPCLFATLELW